VNLDEFHHGIRAAREVLTRQGASGAIVIMGSQSILGSFPPQTLDDRLLMSAEVDVMPVAGDEREIERLSDFLHGSLGQDSFFQESNGFHVDGISIETAVLPNGWVHRLIPEVDPASGATGWCLDPHDLAVAKLIAGRPKDVDFVQLLIEARLVDPAVVDDAIASINDDRSTAASARLARMAATGLPEKERLAWHRNRQQALRDRMVRTSEQSPAELLAHLLDSLAEE